jgi:hypothetical protein
MAISAIYRHKRYCQEIGNTDIHATLLYMAGTSRNRKRSRRVSTANHNHSKGSFMSVSRIILPVIAAWIIGMPALAADPTPAEKEVVGRVQELLKKYEANDQDAVVAMLDKQFTLLGTSFNEQVRTPAELRELMRRDFEQWGKATFSDLRDIDVRVGRELATVYFVFTFAAQNGGGAMPIRGCTTWRKVDGQWLLTQSASAVPPQ